MFGYVRIRKPELKIKDYVSYRGFYCGLCHALREEYGWRGQMTLSYEMSFLVILLSSVYDLPLTEKKRRCMVHPFKAQRTIVTEAAKYAADMNVLFSYYHFRDDEQDEPSLRSFIGVHAYRRLCRRIVANYPRQAKALRQGLKSLSALEKASCRDAGALAHCFGSILAELFVWREDGLERYFRDTGYYLGRFIYRMDAYDDLPGDRKKGCFNPYKTMPEEKLTEQVREELLGEIAAAGAAFEKLPCLEYRDILRNILYAGVWNRFDIISAERTKQKEETIHGSISDIRN